jgi:tetrahydromethanopterin S-methyltransferase subunit G
MKNAEKAQDQIVFKEKYDSLIKRLDPLQERLKIIESEKQ